MSFVDAIKRYLFNAASAVSVRFQNVRTDGLMLPSITAAAAAGGVQSSVGAFAITNQLTIITTGHAARGSIPGAILPVPSLLIGTTLNIGSTWTVRNAPAVTAATNAILVYPPAGGIINGLAANTGYPLQPGDTVEFILTGGTQAAPTYVTKGVTISSACTQFVAPADANQTIVASDIGTLFSIQALGGARTWTLPAANTVPPGFWVQLTMNAVTGQVLTIAQNAADGVFSYGVGLTATISFFRDGTVGHSVNFSNTATAGSTIILRCNGVTGANAWTAMTIGGAAASPMFVAV